MSLINEFSVSNKKQTLMYMSGGFKAKETTESSTIPENTWAYSETKGYHYKIDNVTSNQLSFNVGYLEIGDRVELSLDVMILSGTTPALSFNIPSVGTIDYKENEVPLSKGFVKMKLHTTNTSNGIRTMNIGGSGYGSGEGYIRNVRLKVIKKDSVLPIIQVPLSFKTTAIGVLEEWKNATDNVLTIERNTIDNQFKVIFKSVPAIYYLRPVVTIGSFTDDNSIYMKFTQATQNQVVLKPYKQEIVDGVLKEVTVDVTKIPNYSYFNALLTFQPIDYKWQMTTSV